MIDYSQRLRVNVHKVGKEVEQSITLLAERELCEKQLQDERTRRTEEAAKREEELNEECRRSEEEAAKPEKNFMKSAASETKKCEFEKMR